MEVWRYCLTCKWKNSCFLSETIVYVVCFHSPVLAEPWYSTHSTWTPRLAGSRTSQKERTYQYSVYSSWRRTPFSLDWTVSSPCVIHIMPEECNIIPILIPETVFEMEDFCCYSNTLPPKNWKLREQLVWFHWMSCYMLRGWCNFGRERSTGSVFM